MPPPRPDPRHDPEIYAAVRRALADPHLRRTAQEVVRSEGWRRHVEFVEGSVDRAPRYGEVVVADLSRTTIGGYFSLLDRQIVLDRAPAAALLNWQQGSPWVTDALHELLHAAERRPLAARLARPSWWPGQRKRHVERILSEGALEQLTSLYAGLPRLPGLPFASHSAAYEDEVMAVGLLLEHVARVTKRPYEVVLGELFHAKVGRRREWLRGQAAVSGRRLDALLLELASGLPTARLAEIREELRVIQ